MLTSLPKTFVNNNKLLPSLVNKQSSPEPPSSPELDDNHSSLSSKAPVKRMCSAPGEIRDLLCEEILSDMFDGEDLLPTKTAPQKRPATGHDWPEPKNHLPPQEDYVISRGYMKAEVETEGTNSI